MEIKAQLNYLRIAPRKVRVVVDVVRGMSVRRAELELRHLPARSAGPLRKLLRSAVASAKHDFNIADDTTLYVREIAVNPGPVLKRSMPRAFGRSALIRKRTSHVRFVLATRDQASTPLSSTQHEKSEPIIRDIQPEDVSEVGRHGEVRPREERYERGEKRASSKSPGFVRRIFQRKAI